MNTFTIDHCEFGIDPEESSVVLRRQADGSFELTIEIEGAQENFDAVTADEESRWSWALYPPCFYARGIPISQQAAESGAEIVLAEEGELEMSLYMMAHNEVRDLHIRLNDRQQWRVTGQVDVFGKTYPFGISFDIPAADV